MRFCLALGIGKRLPDTSNEYEMSVSNREKIIYTISFTRKLFVLSKKGNYISLTADIKTTVGKCL